jgi:Protein of unknown function DUF262/Protein of unknown function (DUF1524)
MKVDKLTLERVFERTERLEAPLFQRPYVWGQGRNWEPLWASIQMVAERRLEKKPVHPHFLGTVVLDQLKTGLGKIHVRHIIDGQQRLTTLQLALAASRDLCSRLNEGRYAKAFEKLTFNEVPLSDNPDDAFKVWPTNADREDFRAVLKAGSPVAVRKMEHARPDDEWLIPNAYLYFHDTIDEWLGPAGTDGFRSRLDVLYTTMRDDIHLVVIDLEPQDDAQEIFETLNALGTPLLPADLVKNYLFHLADAEEGQTERLYELNWKQFDRERGYWRKEVRQGRLKRPRLDLFLYHYLTLILRDEVLVTQLFSAYRDVVEASEGEDAAAHMARFKEYADVYQSFEDFRPDTREALFFYRLEQLDTTTIYPVLLEATKRFDNPEGRTQLHQILGDFESFFVRRAVCELTGKNYNKMTVELLREFDKTKEFSARVIRTFLQRQETEVSRWPSDEEFRKAWMEIDFYKRLKRSRGRMILEALEAALHTGKSEKVQVEKKLTIEHLLPREWEDHWPLPGGEGEADKNARARNAVLHKVGNLSLLTKRLNPSVSNSAWEKKRKDILRHSALNLNRELPDVWDEVAIVARSEELFKIAVKVWPRP